MIIFEITRKRIIKDNSKTVSEISTLYADRDFEKVLELFSSLSPDKKRKSGMVIENSYQIEKKII